MLYYCPLRTKKGVQMRNLVPVVVLMAVAPVLAPGQQSPKSTGPSGTTTAIAENYEAVTKPSELGLDVQVAVTRMEFGNNPGGPVHGTITSLTIGGKELALTSPEIVDGHWITTKDYGRIKIESGALGRGLVISLKPSQKASLLKVFKEAKSSK
jgi:hypothetical protein